MLIYDHKVKILLTKIDKLEKLGIFKTKLAKNLLC